MLSDTKNKLKAAVAQAITMPVVTQATLTDKLSGANFTGTYVKRFGSVVICPDLGDGPGLMMALDYLPSGPWESLHASLAITPTGTLPTGSVISDKKPKATQAIIGSFDFPVYSEATLLDADSYINSEFGGKKFGACVIVETATQHLLVIATGNNPTDDWVLLDGTGPLTPTGLTVTPAPHDKKPLVKEPQVAAIPFSVFTTAELSDAEHPVNAGDGTISGKDVGAIVVQNDAGTPKLVMAEGQLPTSQWTVLDHLGLTFVTPS